jgi:MYXO-CTERM domain-containing protein
VLVVGAAWVPQAAAQGGNGLYEPFPQPRAESRAQAYAARLGVSATKHELGKGLFVGRGLSARAGRERPAASARAGVKASTAGPATLLIAALAGLAALGVARRRSPRPADS